MGSVCSLFGATGLEMSKTDPAVILSSRKICEMLPGSGQIRYGIHQSQQKIHKYNLIRDHIVGLIRNTYNSYFWRNPERYAQYTNEKPKRVKFNRNFYSLYIQKKWYRNEKGNENIQ